MKPTLQTYLVWISVFALLYLALTGFAIGFAKTTTTLYEHSVWSMSAEALTIDDSPAQEASELAHAVKIKIYLLLATLLLSICAITSAANTIQRKIWKQKTTLQTTLAPAILTLVLGTLLFLSTQYLRTSTIPLVTTAIVLIYLFSLYTIYILPTKKNVIDSFSHYQPIYHTALFITALTSTILLAGLSLALLPQLLGLITAIAITAGIVSSVNILGQRRANG